MKTCNKCEIAKALNEYDADKRNKTGLQGICRDCRRAAKQAGRRARMGRPVELFDKKCNKCGQTKPSGEFYKDAGISDGHSTICKDCKTLSQNAWREENREHYNANMRAYNAKHYQKHRLRRYGLTPAEHAQMLADQGGVCKMCGKLPEGKRPLAVDHCHETGSVRGLLCYGCNRVMHTVDNPEILAKALAYKKPA